MNKVLFQLESFNTAKAEFELAEENYKKSIVKLDHHFGDLEVQLIRLAYLLELDVV